MTCHYDTTIFTLCQLVVYKYNIFDIILNCKSKLDPFFNCSLI